MVVFISSPSLLHFRHPEKADSYSFTNTYAHVRVESAQTLQLRVLRPMPKALVLNDCGLPMCALVGFYPWTLA